MILEAYNQFGGVHPETATLRNVLTYQGVSDPRSGEAFSEALLLGIGGGLGSGYILWEFEADQYPSLVLGFQNRWNYPVAFMGNLCQRIGVRVTVQETAGRKKAAANLAAALEGGKPAITWVDLGETPYFQHHLLNVVTVFGIDSEAKVVLVDDRARKPFRIDEEVFAAARARVPSYKNRIMLLDPAEPADLQQAIRMGIKDCLNYLGGKSDSFALPALRKWARLMTDTRHKKGWPAVFKNRRGLYRNLQAVYQSIELAGTGGGGLRGLYAGFLEEAALALPNPALTQVAELYRQLAQQWSGVAEAALPDSVPEFEQTKELLKRRYATLMAKGGAGLAEVTPYTAALASLEETLDASFPLADSAAEALFQDLQERLYRLHAAEVAALQALKSVLG